MFTKESYLLPDLLETKERLTMYSTTPEANKKLKGMNMSEKERIVKLIHENGELLKRIKELEDADFKHREMFTHIVRLIEIGTSVDSEKTIHNMVSKHLKESRPRIEE